MPPLSPETHLHIATAAILAWCAIVDVKHRRIPNRTWIITAGALLPLRLWHEHANPTPVPDVLAWGLGITAVAFLAWAIGLWAGADAKGTMLLAWMVPPFTIGPVTAHPLLYAIPLAFITVLVWQRYKTTPAPFYAFLAPWMSGAFLVLSFLR